MANNYKYDEEYRKIIRKFMALAFVPVDQVVPAFEHVSTELLATDPDHPDNHENFIEYFENTWVGRPRRRPLFNPEMWNARRATEIHLPRTTNNLEAWHLAIQKSVKSKGTVGPEGPNVHKLIEQLVAEQLRCNAIAVKLINGEEVPLYSLKKYQVANERLLNIIGRFYNENYTLDRFLKACSYYVMELE